MILYAELSAERPITKLHRPQGRYLNPQAAGLSNLRTLGAQPRQSLEPFAPKGRGAAKGGYELIAHKGDTTTLGLKGRQTYEP